MKTSIDKHPNSLHIFFMTEMWERYGIYVVQTLLVLYLTFYFKWDDKHNFELVGTFTAMTYISSLVGGWIADYLFGQKRAIILAALILMTSYIMIALFQSKEGLLLSLTGICVGTGLLKPNISSLLGNEYPSQSSKRESGFMLFYIGITVGIFLGSTLPSIIYEYYGWPTTFLSAALGMVFALMVFSYGIYQYKIEDYYPHESTLLQFVLTPLVIGTLYGGIFLIFHYPFIANMAFIAIVVFCVTYIVYAVKTEEGQQSNQNMVIGFLCLISTLFFAFYFQMYSSFSLLVTRIVQPTLFGIVFPAPYYVAIQSIGLMIFGFLFARPKYHETIAGHAIFIGKKFFTAMVLIMIAYIAATVILYFPLHTGALLSPLLIIPVYLTISAAEILLSPTGLAAITLLSSPNKVSTMMGIFFVSLGTGAFLSGKLAILAAIPKTDTTIEVLKSAYAAAFIKMVGLLVLATIFCAFVNVLIKRNAQSSAT